MLKISLLVILGVICSCSRQSVPLPPASPAVVAMGGTGDAATRGAEVADEPAPPRSTLAQAEPLDDSQLAASRAAELEVDRQVAELRRAVHLYTQFLERAQGQPELASAVRKSRERIADAQDTIDFLLGQPRAPRAR